MHYFVSKGGGDIKCCVFQWTHQHFYWLSNKLTNVYICSWIRSYIDWFINKIKSIVWSIYPLMIDHSSIIDQCYHVEICLSRGGASNFFDYLKGRQTKMLIVFKGGQAKNVLAAGLLTKFHCHLPKAFHISFLLYWICSKFSHIAEQLKAL
jgi:hypothetical protein